MKIQNIFVIVGLSLLSGCANPADLVKNWKCQWRCHMGNFDPPNLHQGQSFNTPYGVDQSVIDDYTAYAHSVWPKGHDFFISEADLYEDETGQHAVKIELEVDLRQYVEYYLFYDKNNKRTKVMKGKSWHQFHM
ncbi:MAG TPA: hypothetical protein VE344_11510 [Methylomirabilota bacterium]|nr:hypothetical protein [Methylomirabilota bacterium]